MLITCILLLPTVSVTHFSMSLAQSDTNTFTFSQFSATFYDITLTSFPEKTMGIEK